MALTWGNNGDDLRNNPQRVAIVVSINRVHVQVDRERTGRFDLIIYSGQRMRSGDVFSAVKSMLTVTERCLVAEALGLQDWARHN